jgi:predicted nuclease with TOPRIM domain
MYPSLQEKMDEWMREEREEDREEVKRIVREWEEAHRRMRKRRNENSTPQRLSILLWRVSVLRIG